MAMGPLLYVLLGAASMGFVVAYLNHSTVELFVTGALSALFLPFIAVLALMHLQFRHYMRKMGLD